RPLNKTKGCLIANFATVPGIEYKGIPLAIPILAQPRSVLCANTSQFASRFDCGDKRPGQVLGSLSN
ncbi:hypothetical protein AAGG34_25465, partial [Citrobacter braakii]